MTKHNQPADAITEEALRLKGFEPGFGHNFDYWCLYLDYCTVYVHIKDCRIIIGSYGVSIPILGCKTMQDIDDLIRILGGKMK